MGLRGLRCSVFNFYKQDLFIEYVFGKAQCFLKFKNAFTQNLLQEIFTAALSSLAILSVLGFQYIYLVLIMGSLFDILRRNVQESHLLTGLKFFRTSSHHFSRLAPERSFRFFAKYFEIMQILKSKGPGSIFRCISEPRRSQIGFTQRKDCIRHKKSHKTFTQNLRETSGFLYKKTVRWVSRSQGRNVKVVPKVVRDVWLIPRR